MSIYKDNQAFVDGFMLGLAVGPSEMWPPALIDARGYQELGQLATVPIPKQAHTTALLLCG
ncbi:hypothetical protein U9M48_044653 [Paspalum notatum var. saurae]|uniref:Uncharacterized protein n=1 Tax=Paspalum notatum var. saurae TaxID=547442 RepID=A0AAQ3V042_PASNO